MFSPCRHDMALRQSYCCRGLFYTAAAVAERVAPDAAAVIALCTILVLALLLALKQKLHCCRDLTVTLE